VTAFGAWRPARPQERNGNRQLNRFRSIDQITKLNNEVDFLRLELLGGFEKFTHRFSIVSIAGRWLICVMQIGNQANSQIHGRFFGKDITCLVDDSSRQTLRPRLHESASSHVPRKGMLGVSMMHK
jgi:hypothetical protein